MVSFSLPLVYQDLFFFFKFHPHMSEQVGSAVVLSTNKQKKKTSPLCCNHRLCARGRICTDTLKLKLSRGFKVSFLTPIKTSIDGFSAHLRHERNLSFPDDCFSYDASNITHKKPDKLLFTSKHHTVITITPGD